MAGRNQSHREAEEELHFGLESKLGGMAAGPDPEFHRGTIRASCASRQYCQLGVELFLELSQLLEISPLCCGIHEAWLLALRHGLQEGA